jgi:hypothetical protein
MLATRVGIEHQPLTRRRALTVPRTVRIVGIQSPHHDIQ